MGSYEKPNPRCPALSLRIWVRSVCSSFFTGVSRNPRSSCPSTLPRGPGYSGGRTIDIGVLSRQKPRRNWKNKGVTAKAGKVAKSNFFVRLANFAPWRKTLLFFQFPLSFSGVRIKKREPKVESQQRPPTASALEFQVSTIFPALVLSKSVCVPPSADSPCA